MAEAENPTKQSPAPLDLAIDSWQEGAETVAIAAIRIGRIATAGLFLERCGATARQSVSQLCHDSWADLADGLAILQYGADVLLLIGAAPRDDAVPDVAVAFLALGRGATDSEARGQCRRQGHDLWTLLTSTLSYAESTPITDPGELDSLVVHLRRPSVVELRRRHQGLTVSDGVLRAAPIGFGQADEAGPGRHLPLEVPHLFPWIPSTNSWGRMIQTLADHQGGAAYVVRVRGWPEAPESCKQEIRRTLANAERIAGGTDGGDRNARTVLDLQVSKLREETLERAAFLEGPMLDMRVFLTTRETAHDGLIATVEGCIDDTYVTDHARWQMDYLFRGGSRVLRRDPDAPLRTDAAPPAIDTLFSPREATAVLRTPMPPTEDIIGIELDYARSVLPSGRSGDDVPIGTSVRAGRRIPIRLHQNARSRHLYAVGQTGTGKSTLLLNMILHDLEAGRGVAVLDPHGALIEDLLARYPEDRLDDLVIVDPADLERPVGFNVLRVDEPDPFRYRLARDLLIDDLYSYIASAYNLAMTGGPLFETHFRSMLALLMGTRPRTESHIPNLLLLRLIYSNSDLRGALKAATADEDPMLIDAIVEMERTTGDWSLASLSQYITSKFTRFVADAQLRNITCQPRCIDVARIVDQSGVLFFNFGKGRFGETAAGLLACQVVSRIRHAIFARGATKDARSFHLYADEFQVFADERFAELLAEARKFGLSLTIAHQYAEQLRGEVFPAITGNVGTLICFRVSPADGKRLEPFFAPKLSADDLVTQGNFRACARSVGDLGSSPFTLEALKPPAAGDPRRAERLREHARQRHGRARDQVEKEIREIRNAYMEIGKESEGDESRIKEILHRGG